MNDSNILMKNRRILVIDDNPNINNVWRQLLQEIDASSDNEDKLFTSNISSDYTESECFEIDSAFQGQEGLEKIRQAFREGCPYEAAFVDVRMPPGWDGVKTIEKIWAEYPDLPVGIYAPYSDYSAPEIVEILEKREKLLVFKKPPDNDAIQQFALSLTKEWEWNQATRFEQLLKRVAKEPLANILDPDWIRQQAENGDVYSMFVLGKLYLCGRKGYLNEHSGFQQNRSQAIRWLRKAAHLGYKEAKDKLVEIGEMFVANGDLIDRPAYKELSLLTDEEWSMIDGEVCRVLEFIPYGCIKEGKIAAGKTGPYASVILECKTIKGTITGHITHRIDFSHLWKVFEERTVQENEEVISIWTKQHYKIKLLKHFRNFPKLWVMVRRKGFFEFFTAPDNWQPELGERPSASEMFTSIVDYKWEGIE
jgi:CheY-like chemotaxis protein